ncbi:MAG: PIN domain-containing protein [Pseudomonadota bacterium]
MSKIFIDTNILVYCMDKFDEKRQEKCRLLLTSLTEDQQGVISTQVMQEFYVAATNKLGADPLLTKDILHSFKQFEIVIVNPEIIYEAIDCSIINRISFWDSLVVVSAESARCEKLWTEDLNDGQILRSVQVENPLKR